MKTGFWRVNALASNQLDDREGMRIVLNCVLEE